MSVQFSLPWLFAFICWNEPYLEPQVLIVHQKSQFLVQNTVHTCFYYHSTKSTAFSRYWVASALSLVNWLKQNVDQHSRRTFQLAGNPEKTWARVSSTPTGVLHVGCLSKTRAALTCTWPPHAEKQQARCWNRSDWLLFHSGSAP